MADRAVRAVGWDVEIATPFPVDEEGNVGDIWQAAPFGITCAALAQPDGAEDRCWLEPRLPTYDVEARRFAPRMSAAEVRALIDRLGALHADGWRSVGWNSTAFDWRVLAQECGDVAYAQRCQALCWEHIDPAFQMLCERGFMVGAEAAAVGMGVGGKLEGVKGADAPGLWAGTFADQESVVRYVVRDAEMELQLYAEIVARRALMWQTRRGRTSLWMPTMVEDRAGWRMLTVRECLDRLPLPDTSWMRGGPRLTREGCTAWLGWDADRLCQDMRGE